MVGDVDYFYDLTGRVTKTGAGSSGDIMPTYPPAADLRHYYRATGQMPSSLPSHIS